MLWNMRLSSGGTAKFECGEMNKTHLCNESVINFWICTVYRYVPDSYIIYVAKRFCFTDSYLFDCLMAKCYSTLSVDNVSKVWWLEVICKLADIHNSVCYIMQQARLTNALVDAWIVTSPHWSLCSRFVLSSLSDNSHENASDAWCLTPAQSSTLMASYESRTRYIARLRNASIWFRNHQSESWPVWMKHLLHSR